MNNRIKEILREKGIKQTYVCQKLQINESVLSLIINGKRKPSQSRLKALAKLLGVSIKQMYPHCVVKRQNVYYI
jgi:putative transcriptional regulator